MQTLTIPTPFPVGPVNVYLVADGEPTLIDTGVNDPPSLAALREQLAARGLAFRDLRRILITHAHVDHFGLAAHLVAASGARVWSHARNRRWLTDFEREWEHRYDFYFDMYVRAGVPRESVAKVLRQMLRFAQYATAIPADCFVPLDDGDTLTLGGDAWRVVHAPGHASGLICLYEPQARVLISSDHLLRDITSNPVMEPPAPGETARSRALVDYMASLEKIARLDVRLALPAHGAPIDDVRALIEARRAFHRARLAEVEQQLGAAGATALEICNALFPALPPQDLFLGLSEVIGHLEVLEAEGRVQRDESDGLARYVPTRTR